MISIILRNTPQATSERSKLVHNNFYMKNAVSLTTQEFPKKHTLLHSYKYNWTATEDGFHKNAFSTLNNDSDSSESKLYNLNRHNHISKRKIGAILNNNSLTSQTFC